MPLYDTQADLLRLVRANRYICDLERAFERRTSPWKKQEVSERLSSKQVKAEFMEVNSVEGRPKVKAAVAGSLSED